jgi:hydrogenase maturation protease
MPEVTVIGCGNPLRGDDGLAWQVARQLARQFGVEAEAQFLEESQFLSADGTVEILACQQLTLDLLETVHQAGRVIFVDASVTGEPGTLTCETVSPDTPQNLISHQFDPPTLLAAVQALYGACPEAVLLSITAQSFDYVEQLSTPVAAALPELLRRVEERVMAKRVGE